jgi:hypothetical protein
VIEGQVELVSKSCLSYPKWSKTYKVVEVTQNGRKNSERLFSSKEKESEKVFEVAGVDCSQ